jgi:hypothetical protein
MQPVSAFALPADRAGARPHVLQFAPKFSRKLLIFQDIFQMGSALAEILHGN